MQLVATGLSKPGYVTATTIMGLENVLDHVENWQVDWGRQRGRVPQLYWLRVFGEPDLHGPWSWRFGVTCCVAAVFALAAAANHVQNQRFSRC